MKFNVFVAYLRELPDAEKTQFSQYTLENIHKPFDTYAKKQETDDSVELVDVLINIHNVISSFDTYAITTKRNYIGYISETLKLDVVKQALTSEQFDSLSSTVKAAKDSAIKAVNSAAAAKKHKNNQKNTPEQHVEIVLEDANDDEAMESVADEEAPLESLNLGTDRADIITHYVNVITLKDKHILELQIELANLRKKVSELEATQTQTTKNDGKVEVLEKQIAAMWEFMKLNVRA